MRTVFNNVTEGFDTRGCSEWSNMCQSTERWRCCSLRQSRGNDEGEVSTTQIIKEFV